MPFSHARVLTFLPPRYPYYLLFAASYAYYLLRCGFVDPFYVKCSILAFAIWLAFGLRDERIRRVKSRDKLVELHRESVRRKNF